MFPFGLAMVKNYSFVSFWAEESTGEQGNPQENFMKQYQNILTPLLFIGFILSSTLFAPSEQKEVSLNRHLLLYFEFSLFQSLPGRMSLVPCGV